MLVVVVPGGRVVGGPVRRVVVVVEVEELEEVVELEPVVPVVPVAPLTPELLVVEVTPFDRVAGPRVEGRVPGI